MKTAEDSNQRDAITPHGTIIDETGRYYLVRWNSVPAVVKPVTDWGYAVWKIAPAQPEIIAETQANGPANSVNGWALLEQVRPENVDRIVNDLVQVGAPEAGGFGSRHFAVPGNQIAADYLYQELESYGLTVWFEDFLMWDGRLLVNVVAEIPGKDKSEYYGIMAHLDSMNHDNRSLAPGADDNASGLAVTLEVARVLASYELEHPIRIALVNAEEDGLYGATAWARGLNQNGVNMVGVYNIDSVGSVRNRPTIFTNADDKSAWMQTHLGKINTTYSLHERFENTQKEGIVADDNFVRDQGIPAILVARELFGANEIHHTVNDIPANVSMGGIVDTTNIILLAMWDLAK